MFNKDVVKEQGKIHESFYLYDEKVIKESIQRLQSAFSNAKLLYSVKTNANKNVVKCVLSNGVGVDAASANEVEKGVNNNVPKEMIQFSAPGKTKKDIKRTIDKCLLIADSLMEIERINNVAEEKGIKVEMGVRINPVFGFYDQEKVSSKFGIDEDQLLEELPKILEMRNIEIVGIHVHLRSQELDQSILERYYSNVLKLAKKIQSEIGRELKFVNMGSGIGIPYALNEEEIDVSNLGEYANECIAEFKKSFPKTIVYIETGRYLVGKSGVYVTTVLDKKISYGKTYIILKNTLNGFVRPSLIKFVESFTDDKNPKSNEPLFTNNKAFQFIPLVENKEIEKVTLVGNMCTGADIIGDDMMMPALEVGDLFVITNAGSYASEVTPKQFSSQEPPSELYLKENGEVIQ